MRCYISPPIVPHVWRPLSSYTRRRGNPPGIVFHHAAAADCTVEDVNRWHLARGFNGIGYHYFVTREGVIHRGRPDWAVGAHTLGYNVWLGICAEGNYELQKMPAPQLKALEALRGYLHRRYPGVKDKRHKDLNSTACPGRNYPWAKLIQ
jgi:N-acetyl-anhydromuramyl-L-alanine amidase AmpD